MSKVDAMQAMREARYAARLAPRTSPTVSPPALPARKKAVAAETAIPDVEPSTEQPVVAVEEALCGHRSMNNRICRRPAGHSEKNHRYN